MILAILEREKINNDVPIFTLDVNQIALKEPQTRPPDTKGLAPLEYNYFRASNVELCVTPETPWEINRQGMNVNSLGATAYERIQKTQFFKSRPAGLTLSLAEQEANQLWMGIKGILWPSVADQNLTTNQRSDVSQLFFHTVVGSTISDAAFLTTDNNFLAHRSEIENGLGIYVMTPTEAWQQYKEPYGLYSPTETEILQIWTEQKKYLQHLRTQATMVTSNP
jgi:hypothetical protein